MEAYLTPERVREEYGVSVGAVESACARGAISGAYSSNGVWYISKSAVTAWLKRSYQDDRKQGADEAV